MNDKSVLALGLAAATLMLMVVLYALHESIDHVQRERLKLSSCGREDAEDEHPDDKECEESEYDGVEHSRPHVEFTRK